MSAFNSLAPSAAGQTVLAVSILSIAAAAWLALWLMSGGTSADPHSAHHHSSTVYPDTLQISALLFVTGWTLMTVAMMLPTSLPIITAFNTIAKRRADRPLLVVLVIAGYLGAWGLFGLIVYSAILLLQWLAALSPVVQDKTWTVTPLLLILAGAFQLTSLKYRCLDKCRSPLSFVLEHWQGRNERWQAFRLGVDHGVFCVGCCWALMLLMFAVGVGSLLWMAVLAVVMGVEKNAPWGRKLSAPLGVVLLVAGVATFAFFISGR